MKNADIGVDEVSSSEIAQGAVRGSELLDYHVHSGTAVNVNDTMGPTASV